MQVIIESVQFRADQKLIEFTDKRLGKLDQYYDRILEARVYLKLENAGQVKDKVAEVSLDVPGQTLFATATDKTFEAAVDEAADSLRRQLARYKEKSRAQS